MKVVVKIGTASLTNEETGFPKPEILGEISEAFSYMIKKGIKPVLVTSGAIGLGLGILGGECLLAYGAGYAYGKAEQYFA